MNRNDSVPDQPMSDPVEIEIIEGAPAVGETDEADPGGNIFELVAEPTAKDLGIDLPDDPTAARAVLLRHVAEARGEAAEYLETLQRVAADFDNYRKRVERDHAATVQRAGVRIISALLPSLDNFEAALAYETQTPSEEKILDGIRGTYDALLQALAKEGLEPVEALGEPFDPALHEAMGGAVADDGDGHLVVSQELRKGYTLAGRVIRPSLVMVEHA